MKPIIGLLSNNLTYEEQDLFWSTRNQIRVAIKQNGGIAVGFLPLNIGSSHYVEPNEIKLSADELADLAVLLNKCDGIILQGGDSSYNYEFAAKYCYDNNIPLLGIRQGCLDIIRCFGGKNEKVNDRYKHDAPDVHYAHKCFIANKDSLFHSIMGTDIFDVNSLHWHTGTEIPNELSVVAFSDDGQVEVVEALDKDFYMGLMYDPELLVNIDEKQNKIFKTFIETCAKKGRKKI